MDDDEGDDDGFEVRMEGVEGRHGLKIKEKKIPNKRAIYQNFSRLMRSTERRATQADGRDQQVVRHQ